MTFRATVLTLYPEMFPGPLGQSLAGKALAAGTWALEARNIRDSASDRHRTVDDTPAGGGPGMVMRADVLAAAIDAASPPGDPRPRLLMSPRGVPLTQARVAELAGGPGVVVVCGRFEGVDERVIAARSLVEVSVGDFVMAGGEIAALALLDGVVRLLPGVMGNAQSATTESFAGGLLEHPHYTRPQSFEGAAIPDVLVSGDHARIARWRKAEAERVTRERRPDLLPAASAKLSDKSAAATVRAPTPAAAAASSSGSPTVTNTPRTGGEILAAQLRLNGVDRAFCVPGESYLALLDALYGTDVRLTVCRQEGGAAMAAEAWGKLTGRPGIAMVTRGPGAANASAGLHVGRQDSTPMILFVGQVARHMRHREAFQEVDFKAFLGEVAKWVAEIDQPARIPEYVSRAFHEATSGRPGPVVLALPEDMLREKATVADGLPWMQVETYPGLTQMAQLQKLLWAAERPLVIAGGSRWSAAAVAGLTRFAERFDLPIACSFRRQMLFDNRHPNYAGDVGVGVNPALAKRLREADVLLLIGGRMSEMPSGGYAHIRIPEPGQTLVHVHPGAEELGRVYRPTLAINASPTAFVAALEGLQPPNTIPWSAATRTANETYKGWSAPVTNPGSVQLSQIIHWLRERLPEDAILTNGAGNYSAWLHRFFRYSAWGTQLAPTSGSMGYGLPAAIAAKLRHPDRTVVCFAGDGCFQMTSQEFATAVQEDAAVIVIVVNNGIHGTIQMHQERDYPGRVIATTLRDPDFAALARACGGHGARVERTEDFAAAFEAALASGKPAIIDLAFDPEAITPTRTMSQIRGSGVR